GGYSAVENLCERGPEGRRAVRDGDAGGAHGFQLVLGLALAAGDDGPRVPHAPPGRSRDACDEARHRLLAALSGLALDELSGVFLGRTADLADHDDRMRVG